MISCDWSSDVCSSDLLLRRVARFEIRDEAIQKIAELMAYAMGFNLFQIGRASCRERV